MNAAEECEVCAPARTCTYCTTIATACKLAERRLSRKAMTLSVLYGEDGPSALQAARCNAEPRDPRDRDGQKR